MAVENQTHDLTTLSRRFGLGQRRLAARQDVLLADVAVPDLWHAAMRVSDERDQAMILGVWHLAHDLRDKLEALANRADG